MSGIDEIFDKRGHFMPPNSRPVGAQDQPAAAEAIRRSVKPAGVEQHWFVGQEAEGAACTICGMPDVNPVHFMSDVRF